MHATRAAVEEGIVPGGGVTLLRASEHLKGIRTKNDDQKTGVEIVRKAQDAGDKTSDVACCRCWVVRG
jgi:chaperonin GroEL